MHANSSMAAIRASIGAAPHSITWIGGAEPADEEAHAVWEAITRDGLATAGEVAACVADRLFSRDLAAVGPASDIGYFRALYGRLAWQILRRLDGVQVRIGGRAPWAL